MEDDIKQLMDRHKELAVLLLQEPDPWSPQLLQPPAWPASTQAHFLANGDRPRKHIMSAIGPKQTWPLALHMSAFGVNADMTFCGAHVAF
jgi:hypothetical protein